MNDIVAMVGRFLVFGGAGLLVGLATAALARTRRRQLIVGATGVAILVAVGVWATTVGPADDSLAGAAVIVLLVLNGIGFVLGILAIILAQRPRARTSP
jgi:uncharacterized membrane protein YjjP (DUF1212 family)